MKITVIGPTYPFRGGISHYTTLLARELRKEHDVQLVSFKRQYPQWLFPGRSDREPNEGAIRESAKYWIDSLNPQSWLKTVQNILRHKPKIVVMQWWVPFWAPVWYVIGKSITKFAPDTRLVCIVHNVYPHEASLFDKLATKMFLSLADILIAHAYSEAEKLQGLFPDKRIVVTPHPTYAALGEGSSEMPLPIPSDKPLLLFCGLIRPYKGLDILLDAMPMVLSKRDVHLSIVGEMWQDKNIYFEQIRRLEIDDNVTVIDEYVSNAVLSKWIKSADVVVLPYRKATQSGIVQMALGLGTPVITTRVGGLAEAIEDGANGLLVDPEDVEDLAQKIHAFLSNSHALKIILANNNLEQDNVWIKLAHLLISE